MAPDDPDDDGPSDSTGGPPRRKGGAFGAGGGRPDGWPDDAEWPPDGWIAEDEPPELVPAEGRPPTGGQPPTGPQPPTGARTLTWSLTLLGPLLMWTLAFWLYGLAQSPGREPECGGFCLTGQEEVWFVGGMVGLAAVPIATLVGAVGVGLVDPVNRLMAAIGVLVVDATLLAVVAGGLAGTAPG